MTFREEENGRCSLVAGKVAESEWAQNVIQD